MYFTEDDSKTSKTGSVTFNEADAPGGAKGVVDVLNGCKVGDREVKARASTLTIRRPVQPPPPPKITIVRPSAGSKGQQQQQQKSSAGNVATAAAAAASSASVSPGPKESNNVKRRRRALENGEKSYASEIRFLQQRYPDGLTVSK